jgi:hypothetical protein
MEWCSWEQTCVRRCQTCTAQHHSHLVPPNADLQACRVIQWWVGEINICVMLPDMHSKQHHSHGCNLWGDAVLLVLPCHVAVAALASPTADLQTCRDGTVQVGTDVSVALPARHVYTCTSQNQR